MPPLIATLGLLSIARGAAFAVSGGERVTSFPEGFVLSLGQGDVLGIPAPFVVFAAALVLVAAALATTRQGRWIYAIGGNENASRLSGVPVERVKCAVYVTSGILAALGGILYAARFSSASSTAGRGYELSAVAAAVIGGASLSGGEGSVVGAFLGVFVLELLTRGLALLGVRPELYEIAIGLAILLAVAAEQFRRRGVRKSW
jgi:ribose transport system permease protein